MLICARRARRDGLYRDALSLSWSSFDHGSLMGLRTGVSETGVRNLVIVEVGVKSQF